MLENIVKWGVEVMSACKSMGKEGNVNIWRRIEEWLDYAHGFGLKLWVDDDDVAMGITPFNYFDADPFFILFTFMRFEHFTHIFVTLIYIRIGN